MKVKVKDIPVRYNGKTYQPGESLNVKEEYFDSNIYKEVSDNGKAKEGNSKGHETKAKQEAEGSEKEEK